MFGSSSSDNDSTPEPVRKLRAIRSKGLTGSDLEVMIFLQVHLVNLSSFNDQVLNGQTVMTLLRRIPLIHM